MCETARARERRVHMLILLLILEAWLGWGGAGEVSAFDDGTPPPPPRP
jgi:hypothetical protein